jgi:hypothetical protein
MMPVGPEIMTKLVQVRIGAVLLGLSLLLPMGFASPAQAVTCSEVRSMSAAEVAYWAKRLEVAPRYLDALLKHAFCEVPKAQGVVASNSKPKADRPSDR